MPVAAQRAGAGHEEVTHTSKAGKGQRLTAERLTETAHLPHRPGDHHRLGVVAGPGAVGHPGRDSEDVLQRAGNLHAHHVRRGVDPEPGGAEQVGQPGRKVLVRHGDRGGRGVAGHDFLGDVGPREHAGRVPRQHLRDDFGHPLVGDLFQPLDQADDRDPRTHVRHDPLEDSPEAVRGNTHDQDVGVLHGLRQRVGRPQAVSQRDVAEVPAVPAPLVDFLGHLRRAGPKYRRGAPGHDGCHRRPPGAAT